VRRNVRWLEEALYASLLARVRNILAPVMNQQWDYDTPLAESQKPKTTVSALSENAPKPAPLSSSAHSSIQPPSPLGAASSVS